MIMGLLTWVVVIGVILAIIGLGWQTFFGGVFEGAEKVGENPLVQDITNGTADLISNFS